MTRLGAPPDPALTTGWVAGGLAAAVIGLAAGGAVAFGASLVLVLAAASVFVFMLARYGMNVMTLAFIVLVYANVPVVANQFHGVPAHMAQGIIVFVAIPVAWLVLGERRPIVVSPGLAAVGVYCAVMLTAALWARNISGTTETLWVLLTEGVLLYLLVTNAVRTRQVLHAALWMVVIAAALMATLAVFQEATGSLGQTFGGFAQTSGAFTEGDGPLRPRPAGPVGETNRFAQVLLVAFPLAVGLARTAPSRRLATAATGGAILIMGGVLVTFSRGAAVALLAIVLTMVVLRMIRLRHLAVLGVAGVALLFAVAPAMLERVGSLQALDSLNSDEQEVDGSILGRATSNVASFNVFLDHPGLGVGPGQYAPEYSRQYANDLDLKHFTTTRRAHNMYLETAAETGVAGIGALALLIGVTVFALLRTRWRARDEADSTLATALLLAVGAYLLTAAFLHLSYQRYFWLLLALANAAPVVLAVGSPRDEAIAGEGT